MPGFDVTPWVGMFAPAKTPKEIVTRLSKEVDALLKDPEVVKIFEANQIRAAYLDTRAVHQADQEGNRRLGEGHQDARHQGGLGKAHMYNLHLSPEQLEFRDTVRDFVDDEVKPVTLKAERLDARRPQPAGRGAAQGLADGASHAGAARGPGRRRRRRADLLHRHRGACGRRHRRRRGAGGDLGARRAAVRRDDAGAARALSARRSWRTTTITSRWPAASPATTARSASTTTGPPRRAARSPPPRRAAAATGSSTAPRTASPTRRSPSCSPSRRRPTRAPALILVPRDTPGLTVTEQPEPRWYHGSCGQIALKDCPGAGRQSARHRRRVRRRPRRPARPGAQPRHRPRRLRGRAGIRRSFASRAAAASSSTRRSAPSSPRSRSGSTSRATPSGGRPGPPTIRRPSPTAACPTCRSPPSPRCSPPRRSIAPPRTPPNASAPWA